MEFLTDFADQAVILPVGAAVLLGCLGVGWVRGALAWSACVAGVLAAVLALKLVGLSCGALLGWSRVGVASPSGHTASACVVYGGLAALLAPRSRAGALAAAALALGVAVLVGGTRLELRVHTPGEVLLGALAGLSGAAALRYLAGPPPPRAARPWLLAAAFAAMLACHGRRLEAEAELRRLAFGFWPLSACATHDAGVTAAE